ncbi:flavin containing amine oxidoreductase domain-containing protein [Apiospora arundinis]
MHQSQSMKKVAIVGSGSAGIASLWALNRTHHDVYLYEAADRLGGHTNTVEWKQDKYRCLVDTGFIVLNEATYPNFINFLKKVRVPTIPTEMTFSVSRDRGKFEWAGTSLDAVFCQRWNLFSPKFWRMIFDIVRFNQFALDLLKVEVDGSNNANAKTNGTKETVDETTTIGEYLDREGYSEAFKNDYLIPMTAAVWSTSPDKCSLEFPAITLVRFMWNHHLLSTIASRPDWLTLEHGAKSYIDAVMEAFDHVILATHGDQACQIIAPSATAEEKAIMSAFKTSENTAVLHSDVAHLPAQQKAWTAWNYLTLSNPWTGRDVDKVSLTYNMNILQHIPRGPFGDVLVTLNPLQEPKSDTVQGRYSYSHPVYNADAVRAQNQLHRIQNKRGISYAGAWTKYGFHEDGFSSGLYVAKEHLGAKLPFEFVDSTYSRGRQPRIGIRDRLLRVILLLIQIFVVEILERLFSRSTASPDANKRNTNSTRNRRVLVNGDRKRA